MPSRLLKFSTSDKNPPDFRSRKNFVETLVQILLIRDLFEEHVFTIDSCEIEQQDSTRQLKRFGFGVTAIQNHQELSIYLDQGSCELILLGASLTKHDLRQSLQMMSQFPWVNRIPVLVIREKENDLHPDLWRWGCDEVLTKPFHYRHLHEVCERWLEPQLIFHSQHFQQFCTQHGVQKAERAFQDFADAMILFRWELLYLLRNFALVESIECVHNYSRVGQALNLDVFGFVANWKTAYLQKFSVRDWTHIVRNSYRVERQIRRFLIKHEEEAIQPRFLRSS